MRGAQTRPPPRLGVLTRSARVGRPTSVSACAARACACARARARACAGQAAVSARGRSGWGCSGMLRLLFWCLLWLGLLLVRFSHEQSYGSNARKLCGRHLLKRIVELCGDADWSHFEGNTPLKTQLLPQAMRKVESLSSGRLGSSQTTFPVLGRGTNTGKNLNQRHVCLSLSISYPRI